MKPPTQEPSDLNQPQAKPEPGDPERSEALALLDHVLRLQTRKPALGSEMSDFHEAAKKLREAIASQPGAISEEARAILRRTHPIAAVYRLAIAETLSNQEWAEVYAVASQAFGKRLASAAANGDLITS